MKTFKGDFYNLIDKLKRGENFSFIRFSDGELFILQNKHLVLDDKNTRLSDIVVGPKYSEEDHKEFIPEKHGFLKQKLEESLKFHKKNYYVGLSCRCCVGEENFNFMRNLRGGEDDYTTWSNLFVNSNYPLFINNFLPALKNKKIIFICNEKADLTKMPINILKDFRIGKNAMINNFEIYKDISKYIRDNKIENHVFLFSASSLTNITAYELFKENENNTFIDIGTTLNPFMKLSLERSYLKGYWKKEPTPDLMKTCIW